MPLVGLLAPGLLSPCRLHSVSGNKANAQTSVQPVVRHVASPRMGPAGFRHNAPGSALPRAVAQSRQQAPSEEAVRVMVSVYHHTEFGQTLRVVGALPALGNWRPEDGVKLEWSSGDVWTGEFKVPPGQDMEFKVVVYTPSTGESTWEQGANKTLQVPAQPGDLQLNVEWDNEVITPVFIPSADLDISKLPAKASSGNASRGYMNGSSIKSGRSDTPSVAAPRQPATLPARDPSPAPAAAQKAELSKPATSSPVTRTLSPSLPAAAAAALAAALGATSVKNGSTSSTAAAKAPTPTPASTPTPTLWPAPPVPAASQQPSPAKQAAKKTPAAPSWQQAAFNPALSSFASVDDDWYEDQSQQLADKNTQLAAAVRKAATKKASSGKRASPGEKAQAAGSGAAGADTKPQTAKQAASSTKAEDTTTQRQQQQSPAPIPAREPSPLPSPPVAAPAPVAREPSPAPAPAPARAAREETAAVVGDEPAEKREPSPIPAVYQRVMEMANGKSPSRSRSRSRANAAAPPAASAQGSTPLESASHVLAGSTTSRASKSSAKSAASKQNVALRKAAAAKDTAGQDAEHEDVQHNLVAEVLTAIVGLMLVTGGTGALYLNKQGVDVPSLLANASSPAELMHSIQQARQQARAASTVATSAAAEEPVTDMAEQAADVLFGALESTADVLDSIAEQASDLMEAAGTALSDSLETASDMVSSTVEAAQDGAANSFEVLADATTSSLEAIQDAFSAISLDAITEGVGDTLDGLGESLGGITDAVSDVISGDFGDSGESEASLLQREVQLESVVEKAMEAVEHAKEEADNMTAAAQLDDVHSDDAVAVNDVGQLASQDLSSQGLDDDFPSFTSVADTGSDALSDSAELSAIDDGAATTAEADAMSNRVVNTARRARQFGNLISVAAHSPFKGIGMRAMQ